MKTSILKGLSLATVVFLSACSNNAPKEESHEGHAHAKEEVASTTVGKVQLKDATLDAVYQEYLNLNSALVKGEMAAAKTAAHTLEVGAKELPNGSTIVSSAAKISAANSLEIQREAFSDLSNAMITQVKAVGVASGEIYVDYCPMARNDKGAYWLSSTKGIANPYYGDSMLTCGETKETLN